jgi:ubiquinone/menaquinone biosynthesis C-methylase UbiE
MPNPIQQQQPSPELFFQTINGYQRTAAMKAAIELGIFTAIGEGAHAAADIAKKISASERGVRILADYLAIHGLLTKNGAAYGLTQDSAVFLDRRSPAYLGGTLRFLVSRDLTDAYDKLADAVRRGGTPDEGTVVAENPLWVEFARGMAPMMMPAAQAIAKIVGAEKGEPMKVLDIAAGHGIFGIAIAQANPKAEVVAVDWKNVLAVAKEHAEKAGVGARHRGIPGSAFDVDYGSGYDIALLTNFMHHFDAPTNEKLLKKVHAALKPGGRALILEFVPNDDRVSPPMAAGFSLVMLAGTPAGDAYTYKELEGMCRNAGFKATTAHPLDPMPETVIVAVK